MGLNFRRSVRLGKNVRMNLSKSGVGISAGVKGARMSVGSRGIRKTIGIPGTGLYYTKQSGYKRQQPQESMEAEKAKIAANAVSTIIFAIVKLALFLLVLDVIFCFLGVWIIGAIIDVIVVALLVTGLAKKH